MNEAFAILLSIGIGAFVLFGPWILLWRSHRRRSAQRHEDQVRWAELTRRVHLLEQALKRSASPIDTETSAPARQPEVAPTRGASHRPVPVESAPIPPEEQPAFEEQSSVVTPPPLVEQQIPSAQVASQETRPVASRLKSALDVEDKLGANWLNKLGVGLLVLGIAFFLAYQLTNLGPAGKVLVGYVVSAVMLGIGIWLERRDRYRILARAGVGGGWALLFFTTFAMYHVPAAHILNSQLVDLILMLAVAAAMVLHTLHYRSQVVTGLAFVLGFLTVGVSQSDVYSLGAGAVLAAGLAVIVVRMKWFELEVFGMQASYLNHYLWLRPIIEPMKHHRHPFPEFPASAGLLLLYWAVFRASYLLRSPDNQKQERTSTIAAVLNTVLMLLLFKYQSTHPEWAFWALLAIGGIETTLGQLPIARRRRTAVVVLSTLGVILLIAAFPVRSSGMQLSVFWLMEAEALLLIGVWTGEVVFRRLGGATSLLVAGQMVSMDAARVAGMRMDGADVRPQWPLSVFFLVAACVFYANAHWIFPRWSDLFTHEIDRRVMQRLSYVGALTAAIALWMAFPEAWTAVAWSALGLALILTGRRLGAEELRYQANFLAVASILRALSINLESTTTYHGVSQRALTVSLVAILLYVTSRWSGDASESARGLEPRVLWLLRKGVYTWSASLLLGLLAWYELRPIGVAVAWAIGGLLLLEVGLNRKLLSARLQAYAALLAAFLRIFFVNLNASGSPGEISPRFYTILPVAFAFFYSYWRLFENREALKRTEARLLVNACCWMGTITVAGLVRFELEADWVAAGWAALAFGLTVVAWRSQQRVFSHQALLLSMGVLFRTILHNFYQRSYFPAPSWITTRWTTVGTALLLLLAALPFLFQLREKNMPSRKSGFRRVFEFFERRPEQVFFFIVLGLLTSLFAIEMRRGMVTLSWGVEAMAVFVFALWVGERSFRLAGLGLLLLSAAKILVLDVWRLNPSDRYLTLIVLGAALLSVSFLYTRYRETIRQYL